MPYFAVCSASTVVNVVVADDQTTAESVTGLIAVETEGEPWIGWKLIDGNWVAPPVEDLTLDETDPEA